MHLMIVSNRLPRTVSFNNQTPEFKTSSGGLSMGPASYSQPATVHGGAGLAASDPLVSSSYSGGGSRGGPNYFWLGWPGASVAAEYAAALPTFSQQEYKCCAVFLPVESMEHCYHDFCSKTFWPLFHFFPSLAQYDEDCWQEYRDGNRCFGEAVVNTLKPGDRLWVRDNHLMPLPGIVREWSEAQHEKAVAAIPVA